jgi:hypothetical protein
MENFLNKLQSKSPFTYRDRLIYRLDIWKFKMRLMRKYLRWEYWVNERPVEKLMQRRQEEDRLEREFREEAGEADYEYLSEYKDLELRGLYDDIVRRGIKVEQEWIKTSDKSQWDDYKQRVTRYPPFSPIARDGMFATIKKDRTDKLEKWLTRIVLPVLSFLGAYLGS